MTVRDGVANGSYDDSMGDLDARPVLSLGDVAPGQRGPAAVHDLVVVGASAGGVAALVRLVGDLPADFPACVLVVLHLPRSGATSVLLAILARAAALPVRAAADQDPLTPGTILVAPPDRHLMVLTDRLVLARGPHENGHRPGVDPLFRSAAFALGSRVIGVVLTGNLDDGSAGLAVIHRYGGRTVVQDPSDASFPGMPSNALRAVPTAQTRPLEEVGALLRELAAVPAPGPVDVPAELEHLTRREVVSALGVALGPASQAHPGTPSPYACPDCAGVLFELAGDHDRFRCRVGHAWSGESLIDEQGSAVQRALWMALRAVEERTALTRQVAESAAKAGRTWSADHFTRVSVEAGRHAEVLRHLVIGRGPEPAPAETGLEASVSVGGPADRRDAGG